MVEKKQYTLTEKMSYYSNLSIRATDPKKKRLYQEKLQGLFEQYKQNNRQKEASTAELKKNQYGVNKHKPFTFDEKISYYTILSSKTKDPDKKKVYAQKLKELNDDKRYDTYLKTGKWPFGYISLEKENQLASRLTDEDRRVARAFTEHVAPILFLSPKEKEADYAHNLRRMTTDKEFYDQLHKEF